MSKENITHHETKLREEFQELMKTPSGKKEAKQLVEEAEDFFRNIDEIEPYMVTAHIALKEAKENRKLYFQHYSAISQFVDFQRKLNQKPTDNDYIIF